jgi:hypothetical protein
MGMIVGNGGAIRGAAGGEVDWMNRILVVDDDLDLCELQAKYFQREGFEFDLVHNGSQGVERALSGNYALVILDVMLPGKAKTKWRFSGASKRRLGHSETLGQRLFLQTLPVYFF